MINVLNAFNHNDFRFQFNNFNITKRASKKKVLLIHDDAPGKIRKLILWNIIQGINPEWVKEKSHTMFCADTKLTQSIKGRSQKWTRVLDNL